MQLNLDETGAARSTNTAVFSVIERLRILELRGQVVVLDSDLAASCQGVLRSKWRCECCNPAAQSQRDCTYQPWVARNELPRVRTQGIRNPERVESVLLRFWYVTLSGLRCLLATTQGRPSRSRVNLGLNDAIPLGLNPRSLQRIEQEVSIYSTAVKRNLTRFPDDFAFLLTEGEFRALMSQIVISKGRGGRRKLPRVFTEHGAIMAATILR
jgi:hypothetical protein